ncbi:MAG: hypothetical protein ACFFCQ_07895 [Promethearchaeota archaeon]
MNRSKLVPKLIILIIMSMLIISSGLEVQGQSSKKKDEIINAWNRLYAGWSWAIPSPCFVDGSEKSYISAALGQAPWEKEIEQYCPPYDIQVSIDGEPIKLLRFSYNDKSGDIVDEPVHWWWFYHIFEPSYFAEGFHTYEVIFSWRDGYGFFTYDGINILHRQFIEVYIPGWIYVYY